MKLISFIYLQLILLAYTLCDSQERYTQLGKKLFSSLQSFLSFEKTSVISPDGLMELKLSNIRLITPILSKITYEFNETDLTTFKARNAVFTFIADISSDIQKSNIGTLNMPDFLFQLTCDYFEFTTQNKRVTSLTDKKCNDFYFSTDNALGKLKTFSFFSESIDTKNNLTNYFFDIIGRKIDDNLLQQYNLLSVDIDNIMIQLKEQYNGKIIDKTISDYIVHNLTLTHFTYNKAKLNPELNMITYDNSLFTFTIFFRMGESEIMIEGDFKIAPTLKISDKKVMFGIIEYRDCSPYLDSTVCRELFEDDFEVTFSKIHKEYFDNL